ncbi:hypothetical protein C2I36_04990 [Rhodobacteraceae bacterium WD3A24]|nr:hypothetical protein C2I36_04990 [Rhodobacteraceae bacterium WD3A24]
MLANALARRPGPAGRPLAVAAALALALPLGPALGQEDDIMSFVPSGGRTLLAEVIEAGAAEGAIDSMLAQDLDAEGWREWIEANRDAVAGLDGLDEYETRTLANYLDTYAPLDPEVLSDPADALPQDGRDMAMRNCQSCHIITVTITQDRTHDAWLGTLGNPSHVEIELSEEERDLLADYLVVNAGIPIEQVPPALRAGGASY